MDYKYRLPETLGQLVDSDEPDVTRLYRLAHSKAVFQAVRDWPRFRQDDAIMEAAKEACKQILLEEAEEGTAVTNSPAMFSLQFLQTYYGAYTGIIETAQRSFEDMHALVRLLRPRTESDAIAVLEQIVFNTQPDNV